MSIENRIKINALQRSAMYYRKLCSVDYSPEQGSATASKTYFKS